MASAAPIYIGSLNAMVADSYGREQRAFSYGTPHGRHEGNAWKAFDRGPQRNSLSTSPSNLLGSYANSLLEGRMSMNPPSPPVPFRLQLGALGSPQRCPPSLQCPPQVNIDFPASWYEMAGPYVGSASLEHAVRRDAEQNSKDSKLEASTTRHGYRIPPKGQLQLVLKNQLGTIIKVLLIPYDLLDMPAGSKTFLRVRYATLEKDDSGQNSPFKGSNERDGVRSAGDTYGMRKQKRKEVTRYAVHLHFVSPPIKTKSTRREKTANLEAIDDDGTTFDMDMDGDVPVPARPLFGADYDIPNGHTPDIPESDASPKGPEIPTRTSKHPRIFLSKSIRLLFPSRTPDDDEHLRVIREEPGEGTLRFSPWAPTPQRPSSSSEVSISPTVSPHNWHVRKHSLLGR